MSLHRHNPRRDSNEQLIIDTCAAYGCQVVRINQAGLPDLQVYTPRSWRHRILLIEVKVTQGSRLKPAQETWWAAYGGGMDLPAWIVHDVPTTLDALEYARTGE